MIIIREQDTFTQIVRFDTPPEKQVELISVIVGEVERWIRHRPGFVSSTFHASYDGRHVVNYAQWYDEDSFRGFLQDVNAERLHAAIESVHANLKPHAIACHVVKSIDSRG